MVRTLTRNFFETACTLALMFSPIIYLLCR